jgi:hypothetical protein
MRHAFAHDAVLDMDPGADIRAPGAAVTVELCGHWDHEPPCRLAPHHTAVERTGRDVRVRILFATEPEHEEAARLGIERALSGGSVAGPDGVTTTWRLRSTGRSPVAVPENEHAERLRQS